MEGGSLAKFALEPDAPTLHFHQTFGDVQAQAGAGRFARLLVFGAEKFLEDLGLVFGADADAGVAHPQVDDARRAFGVPLVGGKVRAHDDVSFFGRIFVRVADEIGEHLSQARAVRPNVGQFGGQVDFHDLLLVFELAAGGADDFIHHFARVHRFKVQAQAPGLDLRVVVQVRDERGHAFHVRTDRLQEVGLHLVDVAHFSARQQFGITLDGCHRVFELVRHKGDELALGLVRRLDFVVQLRVGDGDGGMVAQAVEERDVLLDAGDAFEHQQADDLRLAPNRDDDLVARFGQETAAHGRVEGLPLGLSADHRLLQYGQVERHGRFSVSGQVFTVALVRHDPQVVACQHADQPGLRA